MIRPMIEAIYDYRMAYSQETNPNARNNYKLPYLQACALVGADDLLSQIDDTTNIQSLISDWNNKNSDLNHDKREGSIRTDYKTKLDEIFKNNGKACYYNREYENRGFNRDKSEDYPQLNRSMSGHSTYSKGREYLPNYGYPSQKYDGSYHKSEYVYTSKYRTDRY